MSIRLDPDVKAALETMAEDLERSLSWVANRALRQWADANKAEIAAAERRVRQSKS